MALLWNTVGGCQELLRDIKSSNRTGRSCPHTTAIYTFCTDWRQNMPGNKHNTWNDRTSSQILHKQPTLHKPPTKHVKRGILFRCLWHANRRCDERQNLRFGSRVSEQKPKYKGDSNSRLIPFLCSYYISKASQYSWISSNFIFAGHDQNMVFLLSFLSSRFIIETLPFLCQPNAINYSRNRPSKESFLAVLWRFWVVYYSFH